MTPDHGMADPSAEYQARLKQRQFSRDQCSARIQFVGYLRLATAILFVALLIGALVYGVSGWFLLVPAGIFSLLALYHDRLYRKKTLADRAVAFYERGLERIEYRWQGKGNQHMYADDSHLYARDLDIFGSNSLYEMLCTARTRSGEETLARWLREPATRAEILRRQEAVRELRNNIDLREDLSMLGPSIRSGVDPEFMAKWATRPVVLRSNLMRAVIAVLAAVSMAVLVYGLFTEQHPLLRYLLGTEIVVALVLRSRVRPAIHGLDEPAKELSVLGLALRRIERESFASERLQSLLTSFVDNGKRPSQEIAYFVKLVDYLNQRRNQVFAPISAVLMWGTQFAFAIEAWRRRCGSFVEGWLTAFGEFEALSALASYAYEHPEDPFPEIVEGEVVLECVEVRHPLLARSACVPNSVQLNESLQLLLVSGSNMSGKSTLLRTVGINVVLAQAGGPVRAARMKLCLLAIGATLRVQDSLQAGVSRFYAEISRLHDTMELTSGGLPVLFLLDEILHGTNSHDRAIGAEAVVRGLLDRGAIGLVTTHDLSLVQVAESLKPRAMNVHFQDHLQNGRMVFDYRLHPGVVQKSNALELMRAVGLKV